jgi:hypothetical protein
MRALPIVLCVFVFITCFERPCLGEEGVLELFSHTTQNGHTNVCRIPISRLKEAPLWTPGEEPPPLEIGKAVTISKDWLVSRGNNSKLWVEDIEVRPLASTGIYRHIFYYNIRFGGVGLFGHYQRCLLLMNGNVILPECLGEKAAVNSLINFDE